MNFSIRSCKASVWPRLPVAFSASHLGVSQAVAGFPPVLRLNTGCQCRLNGSQCRPGPPLVLIVRASSLISTSCRPVCGRKCLRCPGRDHRSPARVANEHGARCFGAPWSKPQLQLGRAPGKDFEGVGLSVKILGECPVGVAIGWVYIAVFIKKRGPHALAVHIFALSILCVNPDHDGRGIGCLPGLAFSRGQKLNGGGGQNLVGAAPTTSRSSLRHAWCQR